ncbi:hypothetical protein BCR39DRAFT_546676 [Naematelia encephala]|uniref:CsbD-like domain-containing protein n=1 Tax=Naematelia encephala TaxID=71784 RepID=A0A1Y2AR71_9TREE|nr:hypothetical protein BCR39DRAFT_546676 [Naematelia encephala]
MADPSLGIGEKVKAGWNLFHGAGEELRGTVNNTADQLGDAIAGRGGTGATPATRTGGGEHPAQVAASGEDEMRAGLAGLKK